MAVGFVIKFFGTVMDLFLPMILAHILDDIAPTKNSTAILFWGGVMVAASVAALIFNITANRMAAMVSRNTTRTIRNELYRKISYLSSKQIDTFTIPSLESRLTSDTYNIHHMLNMSQRLGVRAPILLIGGIIITMRMEPVLSLVLLATLPLIAAIVFSVTVKGTKLYTVSQNSVDSVTRIVRENISGIRIVKALANEPLEIERFAKANTDLNEKETRASAVMAITSPCMTLILNIGFVGVIFLGAYRVNGGFTQSGTILAFMQYFTIILNAMLSVTRIFIMMSRGGASANRIGEVLDAGADMQLVDDITVYDRDAIRFDGVTFSYNGKKRDLDSVSFSLKHGETLGIIGPTGAGKSTLISLILRFYDADQGVITIDGRNIKSYPREELTRKFGVALQNDFLFADTVRENIDFGRSLDDADIDAAARDAQAKEFIDSTDDGYGHMLAIKGSNISGGQKQRLLITRALAGNPEILILDDSSSALDYQTDAYLRAALQKNHSENVTKIIVAQRVSSICNADLILVLEDGRVTAMGKHGELIESSELYREIANSQMGGAILE